MLMSGYRQATSFMGIHCLRNTDMILDVLVRATWMPKLSINQREWVPKEPCFILYAQTMHNITGEAPKLNTVYISHCHFHSKMHREGKRCYKQP